MSRLKGNKTKRLVANDQSMEWFKKSSRRGRKRNKAAKLSRGKNRCH